MSKTTYIPLNVIATSGTSNWYANLQTLSFCARLVSISAPSSNSSATLWW